MTEYVGFDVSKEETAFCVKDVAGKILARGKVATDPRALFAALREHCPCPGRIVLETGTLSGWLARDLGRLGVSVDVIDARHANAVMRLQHNKTDANDAELLAEIARTGFCRPVAVKSEVAQEARALLKARCHLVRQRRDTENAIRGLLGSLGLRFPKGSGKLAGRVREALEGRPELKVMIEPLLSAAAALGREIGRLDEAVVARAKGSPACRLLMSTPGVGPVTALAYVATIGEAERFAKSRTVDISSKRLCGAHVAALAVGWDGLFGAHLEHGDAMLRALAKLYEAANSLLTVVRRAHPLKDWARRIKRRTSHKKACVALARRLAVILHRMLITGEAFRWPEKEASAHGIAG